nr:hypothetical protein CFP56_35608 [Quercus suber]
MNFPTQLETRPLSSPSPFNNPAKIVTRVGRYGAALGWCEDTQAKGPTAPAKSRCDRSPHQASGAAESRRNPDSAMRGGQEGCP